VVYRSHSLHKSLPSLSQPTAHLRALYLLQKLPSDYYKEFLRVPYAAVTVFTLGAYMAHPAMQQAAFYLHW
jgi:hypothetical protein